MTDTLLLVKVVSFPYMILGCDKKLETAGSQFFREQLCRDEKTHQLSISPLYDSPINRIREGEEGMIKEYDKENDRTTLVDDEVRVYKGGSWRDREYWLDPAQRRYLPQTMATDDIGFRNAMSRVGSKSTKNKTPRN